MSKISTGVKKKNEKWEPQALFFVQIYLASVLLKDIVGFF